MSAAAAFAFARTLLPLVRISLDYMGTAARLIETRIRAAAQEEEPQPPTAGDRFWTIVRNTMAPFEQQPLTVFVLVASGTGYVLFIHQRFQRRKTRTRRTPSAACSCSEKPTALVPEIVDASVACNTSPLLQPASGLAVDSNSDSTTMLTAVPHFAALAVQQIRTALTIGGEASSDASHWATPAMGIPLHLAERPLRNNPSFSWPPGPPPVLVATARDPAPKVLLEDRARLKVDVAFHTPVLERAPSAAKTDGAQQAVGEDLEALALYTRQAMFQWMATALQKAEETDRLDLSSNALPSPTSDEDDEAAACSSPDVDVELEMTKKILSFADAVSPPPSTPRRSVWYRVKHSLSRARSFGRLR